MTMLLTGAGKGSPGGGGGATLFMDETGLESALAGWSIPYRLRAAATNDKILVRRSSDSTTLAIPVVSNELDTATLNTFMAGTDAFLVTVYDDSGNGRDLTQATTANQPQIGAAGVLITGANGKACARFDGSNDKLGVLFTINQPSTYFCVFTQQGWTSSDGVFGGGSGVVGILGQTGSSPNMFMASGTAATGITGFNIAAWNLGTFIFNGASSTWSRNNGSDTTVNPNTSNSTGFTWGARAVVDASTCGQVDFQETVIYGTTLTAGVQTTARLNINARYALW